MMLAGSEGAAWSGRSAKALLIGVSSLPREAREAATEAGLDGGDEATGEDCVAGVEEEMMGQRACGAGAVVAGAPGVEGGTGVVLAAGWAGEGGDSSWAAGRGD